jgi:hypothetical protein
MQVQIVASLGLLLGVLGSVLMFIGTWGEEPEPGLSSPELIKAMGEQNDVESLSMRFASPQAARQYRIDRIGEALHGAGLRNKGRRRLNRYGFGLLMVSFALQFAGLWL